MRTPPPESGMATSTPVVLASIASAWCAAAPLLCLTWRTYRPASASASVTLFHHFGWPGLALATAPLMVCVTVTLRLRRSWRHGSTRRDALSYVLAGGLFLAVVAGAATIFVPIVVLPGTALLCVACAIHVLETRPPSAPPVPLHPTAPPAPPAPLDPVKRPAVVPATPPDR
jgi:hypothetical protein